MTKLHVAGLVMAAAIASGAAGCGPARPRPAPGDAGHGAAPGPRRSAIEQNADCCMCHQPFLAETFSVRHAKHDIACAGCHGPSRAHSTDETFRVPPDVTFKPGDVDPYCLTCHARHPLKPDASAGISDTEHPPRCTVCHAPQHRIARKTTTRQAG